MKIVKPNAPGFKSKVGFTLFISALCFTLMVQAQTQTNNYVLTQAPRVSGIINDSTLSAARADKTKVQVSIQYVDGLGRPVQTVQQQASPLGYDMIAPQAYDAYGREITKYLPFAPQTGTAGSFRPNAVSTDQHAFYTTPPSGSNVTAITDPIAQTAFDNSPLNRPVEQGAPGVAWQLTGVPGGGHTVKMVYTLNNSISFAGDSINGRQVAMYYTTINSDNSQTLTANGYYPANTLTVTISKDENWASGRAGTVEEYKDIDGHVVLKRVYNYTGTVQVLSTYYVYDDLGRLAFVLPPGLNADTPTTYTLTQLNGLAYMYQYDLRGRPVEKLVPGKGWQYTVYNNMDQPVATQDGNQRANKQWVFTKYDALQRPVMSIIWNNGGTAISRAALQGVISGFTTNLYESSTTTGNGYTNVVWPTTNITATLGLNYYDNYTNIPGLPAAYAAPAGANMATRGEATGNLTAVLNTPANMLWKISYYDYWGRSLKSYVQHYLGGTLNNSNYDAISSTYNFTNAPTTTTRQHFNAASTSYPLVTIFNKYIYDNVGRKLKTWEQLTNTNLAADTLRLVSQIKYNEIGQVYEKQLHSKDSTSFLQNINYGYNERGWLLSSSAPLFAMQLYYNTGTNKQYNGNIAYQYWGVPGNLNNNYTYTYDKLNRLISGATADHNIERGITYDPMGNITHLSRLRNSTLTDSLTYTYTTGTNQIANINDKSGNNNGLVNGTTSYSWEPAGNGNLLSSTNTVNTSQNKSFTYNLLNLPLVATFAAGTATYTYDATGNKLRKVDLKSGVTTTTDYISGIEYDNSTTTIGFIQTEEGKAVPTTTGGYDYNYYISDNLGNTRITFGTKTGAAVLYQQDDYYPFGLEISRSVLFPKNEYLYNKKELQEETQEYDYGARFYDPVIGRWNTIDPLAELNRRESPYLYVSNNPIRLIDPDGMEEEDEEDDKLKSHLHHGSVTCHCYAGEAGGAAPNDRVRLDNGYTFFDKDVHSTAEAAAKYGDGSTDVSGQTLNTTNGKTVHFAAGNVDSWDYVNAVAPGFKMNDPNAPQTGPSFDNNAFYASIPAKGLNQLADALQFAAYAVSGGLGAIESGGIAGAAEQGTNSVYQGFDAVTGEVKYVGITERDVGVRWAEHIAAGGEKSLLQFRVVDGATGLSRIGARVWEQSLINDYGLGNLLNKINSIAPKYWEPLGITP